MKALGYPVYPSKINDLNESIYTKNINYTKKTWDFI